MSYHNLLIVGNLGRDPEMRYTQNSTAVTTLNIATNSVYTDKSGQKVKKTVWFRVSAWGKQAESCNNYLKKGSMVLVEGEISADEDGNPKLFTRNDGSTGASYEVMAKTVRFLDNKSASQTQAEEIGDEDIPF